MGVLRLITFVRANFHEVRYERFEEPWEQNLSSGLLLYLVIIVFRLHGEDTSDHRLLLIQVPRTNFRTVFNKVNTFKGRRFNTRIRFDGLLVCQEDHSVNAPGQGVNIFNGSRIGVPMGSNA